MNNTELEQVLKKTTKVLAGEDVNVIMEGFQPRVEYNASTKKPERIFIPSLPEGTPEKLVQAIHGYIDHECSHIMFSDPDHICDTSKSKLWGYIHNCIEDPRVNKAISNYYAGSAKNIRTGYKYLFEDMVAGEPETNPYSKEYVDAIDTSDPKVLMEEQLRYASLWFAYQMGDELSGDQYKKIGADRIFEPLEKKMDSRWIDLLKKAESANDVRNLAEYYEGFFSKEAHEAMNPESPCKGEGEMSEKEMEEHFGDAMESLEDKMAERMKKELVEHTIKAKKGYYWTNRFDKFITKRDVCKHHRAASASDVKAYEDEVKSISNYLNKDLRRLLEERRRRYYVGGYKSGKLNTKSLFSVRLGNDRIFKRKNEVRDINAAVGLLVDMSGSMSGSRVRIAMQSAYAFGLVLDQLKVPYEIFGFTTENGDTEMQREWLKQADEMSSELQSLVVNESSPERVYSFKGFHENFDIDCKRAMITVGNGGVELIQNEDSKHVKMAIERLSLRSERAKALFVFSDGSPAFHGHYTRSYDALKHHTKNAKNEYGVDVFGIGIQNDNVEKFYANNRNVEELSELPEALFGFLRKVI